MKIQKKKVTQHLTAAIARGDFPVGKWLPSAEVLAERTQCSPHSVRRALRDLNDMGILESVKRKGTRVSVKPSMCSVLLMLASDEHTNLLLQTPVASALAAAGCDISIQPMLFGENNDVYDRLRHIVKQEAESQILVAFSPENIAHDLQPNWLEFADSFAARVVVGIEETHTLPDSVMIVPDSVAAGRQVAEHLAGLGHCHVGVVAGGHQGEGSAAEKRAKAMAEFLDVLGRKTSLYYYYGGGDVVAFLRRNHCTAWWAATDHQALQHVLEFQKAGMRIPEDVSVVGMFDAPWATKSLLQLTTLSIDPSAIAEEVARAVGDIVNPADTVRQLKSASVRYVRPKLVSRHSTAKCG